MNDFEKRLAQQAEPCSGRVTAEFRDGIVELSLNVPQRLNAIDLDMVATLMASLDLAAQEPLVRAVVITGRGRAFSSGQNLDDVRTTDGEPNKLSAAELLERGYNPLIRKIRSARLPIIAAVNGVVAGGSMGIALACDFVVAARSASFVQGFSKLAMVPACGTTWFLPRLIGEARTRALLFLNEPIAAEEAARIGLIHRCVDDEEIMPTARAIASKLSEIPRRLLGDMKGVLRESAHHYLAVQLDLESILQREADKDPAHRKSIKDFLEHRIDSVK